MLELVGRDSLAVAYQLQYPLQSKVLAVADIGLAVHRRSGFHLHGSGIAFLDDEAAGIGQHAALIELSHLDAGHIGLIGLEHDLLDDALSDLPAVVVHQEYPGTLLRLVLDRQEELAGTAVVAENSQARTLVHALHAADTLVVVYLWSSGCGTLGNGSALAGK